MKAIVLAAGMGNRLSGVFDDPKCLMFVGGICLLKRYLDSYLKSILSALIKAEEK